MVHGAHMFVLSIDAQAGLQLVAVVRKVPNFLSVMWCGMFSMG
jgi:hypothetical protein